MYIQKKKRSQSYESPKKYNFSIKGIQITKFEFQKDL